MTLTKTESDGYINYTFPSIGAGEMVYVNQKLSESENSDGRVFVKDNGGYLALWGTSVYSKANTRYMDTVTSNNVAILTYSVSIYLNMLLIRMA